MVPIVFIRECEVVWSHIYFKKVIHYSQSTNSQTGSVYPPVASFRHRRWQLRTASKIQSRVRYISDIWETEGWGASSSLHSAAQAGQLLHSYNKQFLFIDWKTVVTGDISIEFLHNFYTTFITPSKHTVCSWQGTELMSEKLPNTHYLSFKFQNEYCLKRTKRKYET